MLKEVTQTILAQLPEQTKLNDQDIATIRANKDFLFASADYIVTDFYDTVFSNTETAKIFHPGEREIREKSLKDWIVKTVTGDFSQEYWEWQTFVGILHIKRKVSNNMMIAMMGRVSDIISTEAIKQLPPANAIELKNAWSKN
ncbi:MAG: protoglobin domain-containing protein [Flavobacteriaceae bacterium]